MVKSHSPFRCLATTFVAISTHRLFRFSPRVVGARRGRACSGLREIPACGGGCRRTKSRGEIPQKAARTRRRPKTRNADARRGGVQTPPRHSPGFSGFRSFGFSPRVGPLGSQPPCEVGCPLKTPPASPARTRGASAPRADRAVEGRAECGDLSGTAKDCHPL